MILRMRRGMLVVLAAVAVAALGAAADGARNAPSTFRLVFDGRHTAALSHEGPFTTSASFCPSGYAADDRIEAETDTAVRTFRCSGSADQFTARITPVPAEHGGSGSWLIVSGAGALATLRGRGTWTSVRLSGTDADPSSITYRSTWQGVTDFDVSPPTIAVSKATARKLRRPKGTFQLRFALSFAEAAGSAVAYELRVIDPRSRLETFRSGETETGTASLVLRVKPTKRTRIMQVRIAATDPVGNAAQLARTLRLR